MIERSERANELASGTHTHTHTNARCVADTVRHTHTRTHNTACACGPLVKNDPRPISQSSTLHMPAGRARLTVDSP